MGLTEIYMIDKLPYRVEFAKKLGATESFLLADDYSKKIKELTNGMGTTLTFDTGGTTESIDILEKLVDGIDAGRIAESKVRNLIKENRRIYIRLYK